MRIGVNAHLLHTGTTYRATGVSNYIRHLLQGLSAIDPCNAYTVFTGRWARHTDCRIILPLGLNFRMVPALIPTDFPPARILWEQTVQPVVARNLDVLHNPVNVIPIAARVRQVVTIHDLAFLHFRDTHLAVKRLYLTVMTRLSARRARAIITDSEFTRQDVIRHLQVPAEKVVPIPLAPDSRFRPLAPSEQHELENFRQRKGLPERYFLYVGTLEPRKNLPRMLQGYAQCVRQWKTSEDPPYLVLAGPKGWMFREVFQQATMLGLEDRVLFPGFIPQEEMIWWINGALAFLYLSAFEGFGLPPLEAMACGVPVIVNDATAIPEVVGDAGILVDANSSDAVAQALQAIATQADLRAELRQRSLERAAQFSWHRTAEATLRVYTAVCNQI
ncbi:MAG: glycosyltransferase family 1 protein [Chloroherpetonaceae bacterium]|nr:glycosyltransferase family 4 protein [Chthonomonadaceae bacterium]MDW8206659.1 glycosyltransferase family 1 protein [Chloroherpetonaceae bacterium]